MGRPLQGDGLLAFCCLWGRPWAEGQADLSRIREKEAAIQGFPDFERRIQAYHEIRIPGKEVQANEQAR
jgi:hypothetical protein